MNTTRRTSRSLALVSAVLMPLWLAVGCGGGDDPDADRAGVDAPPQSTATGVVDEGDEKVTSLTESFDDDANGWAMPANEAASTEVTGGDFVWDIKEAGLRPHLIAASLGTAFDAGQLEMADVRVTATATPQRGAGAFGLFCREVPDTDSDFQWYEFVVRDGYSAIRLADSAGNLDVVEEGDADVPLGEVAELEIGCVGDDLSLTLNGKELLAATAPEPLRSGAPGLQAYDATADESAERMLLAWHNFAVEPAP